MWRRARARRWWTLFRWEGTGGIRRASPRRGHAAAGDPRWRLGYSLPGLRCPLCTENLCRQLPRLRRSPRRLTAARRRCRQHPVRRRRIQTGWLTGRGVKEKMGAVLQDCSSPPSVGPLRFSPLAQRLNRLGSPPGADRRQRWPAPFRLDCWSRYKEVLQARQRHPAVCQRRHRDEESGQDSPGRD
jgi:hypothetical protein